MYKNVSGQKWIVYAYTISTGVALEGDAANITAKISKDGAAGSATNDTNPTELENGFYVFDLTTAETNADLVLIMPESSTSGVDVIGAPASYQTSIKQHVRTGTAQAGASGSITLDASASSTTDFYAGCRVVITGGTGAGQGSRVATAYNGTTKVLTVTPNWATNPDSTSTFSLTPGNASVSSWINSVPAGLVGSGWVKAEMSSTAASVITAASFDTGAIDASALATDAVNEIRDSILADSTPFNGADVTAIVADTNELQTDLANGGRLDLLIDAIKVVTDALGSTGATQLSLSANQIISFTVDTVTNTHTPTTTEFQADDITEATADHYNGRIIIWTSGDLAGQATRISDYEAVGGIGQFTVVAMTEAPANNDTGIIL